MHRNGEGLSKTHAAQIDITLPAEMSHDELTGIASAYSHTQLAEAIATNELKLPGRKKRRTLQLMENDFDLGDETICGEDDEEQQQEDEEGEKDEEDDELVVDRFGIHHGPLCMPSRALCSRVATIVERLRTGGEWTPFDVKNAIIEESNWLLGYVEVDECVIDAALYYTLPALIFSPSNPPRNRIRVWWNSESMWASARVDRVSVKKGELRVDLTFPEEDASGFITGADILFAYEIA